MASIILAGGRSTRMGQPKAMLPIRGAPMLSHVVQIISTVTQPIVVVAAPEQMLPELPSEVLIARDPIEGEGPLVGLLAGMRTLTPLADSFFLTGCDCPLLRPAFIQKVLDSLDGYEAAIPLIEEQYHPLAAAYRTSVLPILEEIVSTGKRSMRSWFERLNLRVLMKDLFTDVDPSCESLCNVNTWEDYERLGLK